jgi:hypothetical protein
MLAPSFFISDPFRRPSACSGEVGTGSPPRTCATQQLLAEPSGAEGPRGPEFS